MQNYTDTFRTALRPQYRNGRRYSLRIDGEDFAPTDFTDDFENPNNLNRDARRAAAQVAAALHVPVEVIKHLATEDRVEGWY